MKVFQLFVLSTLTISVLLLIILANRNKLINGWDWVEYAVNKYIVSIKPLNHLLVFYFKPFWFEKLGKGLLYRIIGTHYFGMILPTGGVAIRRLTKSKMPAYTLEKPSLRSALKFRYRSCTFESVHLAAIISQAPQFISTLATQSMSDIFANYWWNLPVNIYPIMYQRFTRIRIDYLVKKRAQIKSVKTKKMVRH